jgi:hypothetical protein
MSELATYMQLGFRHIVNPDALDHILFLLALAAIYRVRDWRESLWVVTAFTVGHSITLALAATGILAFPMRWIEFLIPATILATSAENLIAYAREPAPRPRRYRAIFAGLFGLIHGAGFATYLQSLFLDRIALPLFGFNMGIEMGQIVVLLTAGAAFTALDAVVARSGPAQPELFPLRLRVIGVSAVVAAFAAHMMYQRNPF